MSATVEVRRAATACRKRERLAGVADDAEVQGARVGVVTICGFLAAATARDQVTAAFSRAVAVRLALPEITLIRHRPAGTHQLSRICARGTAAELLTEDTHAARAQVGGARVAVVALGV